MSKKKKAAPKKQDKKRKEEIITGLVAEFNTLIQTARMTAQRICENGLEFEMVDYIDNEQTLVRTVLSTRMLDALHDFQKRIADHFRVWKNLHSFVR